MAPFIFFGWHHWLVPFNPPVVLDCFRYTRNIQFYLTNFFNWFLNNFWKFFLSGDILQPTNNILQPLNSNNENNLIQQQAKANIPVGSTWTNAGPINIDLDNLMSGKMKSAGPTLTMNQLKLQSPVKTATSNAPAAGVMSPTVPLTPPSALHINNNQSSILSSNFVGATLMSPTQTPTQTQINFQPAQAQQQSQFFGNLMPTIQSNNLNNQFNAFQWYIVNNY